MRPKLLIIGYVWPESNSSAAGGHMMSLLRLFQSQGWDVHFSSAAARGEHEDDLAGAGILTHEIRLNCSSFDRFLAELAPQAVLFDRYLMEEQYGWRVASVCPQAVRLLDMEDMHSLRNARHQSVKQGRSYQEADLHTDQARREVASIFRCDLSLVISSAEHQLLTQHYQVPVHLLIHCPFITTRTPQEGLPFSQRAHFISIGNFRHAPNWDAVLQLKQSIWQRIRAQLPTAQLHIYGAYPPPKATQLHNERDGFLIKGWAADATAVMRSARVCLAPLRFGAGLKGKLLEAMLCNTPSVTTTVGAEGMAADLPWPGALTDSDADDFPDAFAHAAVQLYTTQSEWDQTLPRARDILTTCYNPAQISSTVINQINHCRVALTEHRQHNFIGSMLQHHSMKSTQYMSQWIEAKNKKPTL